MCGINNKKLITKEKKCSECGSENIEPCGMERSSPVAMSDNGTLSKVNK